MPQLKIPTRIGAFFNGTIKRFPPSLWLITAISSLNSAGFSLSLPFLSLYLHQDRGVPMTQVGLIILGSGME